jgi:hypothetical protein
MKKLMLLGWAIFVVSGSAANAAELCTAAHAALPRLAACVETPHGAVLSADVAEARRLADLAQAGEARFHTAFDRAPTTYAILQGEVSVEARQALRSAGFVVLLPWFTRDGFQQGLDESTRRQVKTVAASRGLTPEQTQALLNSVLSQVRQRGGSGAADHDPWTVPHELGHGWYIQAFWPGAAMDGQGHYGGPGPDWLDETAAILMESESSNQERRSQFRIAYSSQGHGTIDDLPTFLHRDQPMKNFRLTGAAVAPGGSGTGLVVMRTEDGGPNFERVRQAGMFYLQGRVFADFMIETSGRPAIFASIGAAFGAGRTIEQWLADNGSGFRVGRTMAELDARWKAWLLVHYGAPAPVPAH